VAKSKRAKHKSFAKEIKPLMATLDRCALVSKVVLGISDNARHSFTPGKAKFQYETPAGFKLNLYTGNGIQRAFVCCAKKDMPAVLEAITEFLAV